MRGEYERKNIKSPSQANINVPSGTEFDASAGYRAKATASANRQKALIQSADTSNQNDTRDFMNKARAEMGDVINEAKTMSSEEGLAYYTKRREEIYQGLKDIKNPTIRNEVVGQFDTAKLQYNATMDDMWLTKLGAETDSSRGLKALNAIKDFNNNTFGANAGWKLFDDIEDLKDEIWEDPRYTTKAIRELKILELERDVNGGILSNFLDEASGLEGDELAAKVADIENYMEQRGVNPHNVANYDTISKAIRSEKKRAISETAGNVATVIIENEKTPDGWRNIFALVDTLPKGEQDTFRMNTGVNHLVNHFTKSSISDIKGIRQAITAEVNAINEEFKLGIKAEDVIRLTLESRAKHRKAEIDNLSVQALDSVNQRGANPYGIPPVDEFKGLWEDARKLVANGEISDTELFEMLFRDSYTTLSGHVDLASQQQMNQLGLLMGKSAPASYMNALKSQKGLLEVKLTSEQEAANFYSGFMTALEDPNVTADDYQKIIYPDDPQAFRAIIDKHWKYLSGEQKLSMADELFAGGFAVPKAGEMINDYIKERKFPEAFKLIQRWQEINPGLLHSSMGVEDYSVDSVEAAVAHASYLMLEHKAFANEFIPFLETLDEGAHDFLNNISSSNDEIWQIFSGNFTGDPKDEKVVNWAKIKDELDPIIKSSLGMLPNDVYQASHQADLIALTYFYEKAKTELYGAQPPPTVEEKIRLLSEAALVLKDMTAPSRIYGQTNGMRNSQVQKLPLAVQGSWLSAIKTAKKTVKTSGSGYIDGVTLGPLGLFLGTHSSKIVNGEGVIAEMYEHLEGVIDRNLDPWYLPRPELTPDFGGAIVLSAEEIGSSRFLSPEATQQIVVPLTQGGSERGFVVFEVIGDEVVFNKSGSSGIVQPDLLNMHDRDPIAGETYEEVYNRYRLKVGEQRRNRPPTAANFQQTEDMKRHQLWEEVSLATGIPYEDLTDHDVLDYIDKLHAAANTTIPTTKTVQ